MSAIRPRRIAKHAVMALAVVVLLTGCGTFGIGHSPLRVALRDHDRNAFERLLKDGADPNAIGFEKLSVMHLCALEEDSVWLKLALNHKGDPNLIIPGASDARRGTPAAWAITRGRLKNVQLLVEAGADINSMASGSPLVVEAFQQSAYDIVLYLLESGADYSLSAENTNSLLDWVNHRKPSLIEDPNSRAEIESVRKWLTDKGVKLEE